MEEEREQLGLLEAIIWYQRKGLRPSMFEIAKQMDRDKATVSRSAAKWREEGARNGIRLSGDQLFESGVMQPRTLRVEPEEQRQLTPSGLAAGKVGEYLWVGPFGALLTIEEQIALLEYLRSKLKE